MENSPEQLGFFQDTTATTTSKKGKCAGIPIYKVTLVREGKLPCYEQRIRSSAIASTILHTYLADVDREHFVILLLDQKNQGQRLSIGRCPYDKSGCVSRHARQAVRRLSRACVSNTTVGVPIVRF